ncbi:MAG: carbamoyltransferase HypF [Myxococcaceae bacterium]|nr:carbamoyltransferase HypF [Myxococcaceae bacterium]
MGNRTLPLSSIRNSAACEVRRARPPVPCRPVRAIVHERRALRVRGVVQGVGFRPFVYRLATSLRLAGTVRNDGEGVWIDVEGEPEQLDRFDARLRSEAPALSRIDSVESTRCAPLGRHGFLITPSAAEGAQAALPADVATCDACLRELGDPQDRRYRYPFICCTDCGPRYTLAESLPWDRARTSMARFPLCDACRSEYEDPGSRRFHAEPNACPVCGPRLRYSAHPARERPLLDGESALQAALALLRWGGIVAIKGLGGYLLAASATEEHAVLRLRARKKRPHKPFAVMVRDLEVARNLCEVDEVAASALASRQHPIVLLRSRRPSPLASAIAPALDELGLMLPSTPLHHLLFEGGSGFHALVMTSGNVSDEPIARTDEEAFARLDGIADGFLFHDREIVARADDSVLRIVRGAPQPIRRARGFVPEAIPLPFEAPPVLAVGPQQKSTVCLTRGAEAFLSPHLGDLDHPETFVFFEESIAHLRRLCGVDPLAVAHDLHPDYVSTSWARASGLRAIAVQHHHAHVAACLVEHGRTGPALGVAFDGTGCGPDGTLWGGELLLADLSGFRRLAHLGPLALAGGEVAVRQVWRLGVAAARAVGVPFVAREPHPVTVAQVEALLDRPELCAWATGAGRWFDAVAALLGVREDTSYEGQAAIELEALATQAADEALRPLPHGFQTEPSGVEVLDLPPAIRALVDARDGGTPSAVLAARFHGTLAQAVVDACLRAKAQTGIGVVALSGGCFQNRLLTGLCATALEREGFEVLLHRKVPPNDGGISLGQAAVAAWRLSAEGRDREGGRCVWESPVR